MWRRASRSSICDTQERPRCPVALECTDCRQSGVIARAHGRLACVRYGWAAGHGAFGCTGDAVHVQRFVCLRGRRSGICTLALCWSPSPLCATGPSSGHAHMFCCAWFCAIRCPDPYRAGDATRVQQCIALARACTRASYAWYPTYLLTPPRYKKNRAAPLDTYR